MAGQAAISGEVVPAISLCLAQPCQPNLTASDRQPNAQPSNELQSLPRRGRVARVARRVGVKLSFAFDPTRLPRLKAGVGTLPLQAGLSHLSHQLEEIRVVP